MDATDRRILKRLQENSRVTVSVLSQEISLSMPAISERLKKLEDELQDLKVVRRKEVAQKIKEAREQGDLSENQREE